MKMAENQQLWSFVDETKKGISASKIPYMPTDFIPVIGLVAHQFRVDSGRAPLEEVIKRHSNPAVPAYLEDAVGRYMNSLVWDWRAKHMRKNLDWKFCLYHIGTSAIPLVYELVSFL